MVSTDNLIAEITELKKSQDEMKHILTKVEHLLIGIDGQNGLRGKHSEQEKRIDGMESRMDNQEKQYLSDKSMVMGWIKGVGLVLIIIQLLPQLIKLFSS